MVSARSILGTLVVCLLVSACELEEVTIPAATPVVVVHSVINVGEPTQFVILEESLTGRSSLHYSPGLVPPAPAGEGTPIEDAYVALTYSGSGNCPRPMVQLYERPPVNLGDLGWVPSGVYSTSEFCDLSPGDSVALRVEALNGEIVRGLTVIPGARSIDIFTREERGESLTLRYGADSVWIDVDPILARALDVELSSDPARAPDGYGGTYFRLAADTMSLVFAGDLQTFEDKDEGEAVFKPGSYMNLTVAVADTNYYDFVRSFSNPLNGRGFINHLEGGIGVFGSVLTTQRFLKVIDRQEDEREGLYRVTGALDSGGVYLGEVDVKLDLYMEPVLLGGHFSAFVDGVWAIGPISTSAEGYYRYTQAAAQSGRGSFEANFMTLSGDSRAWHNIAGAPTSPSSSFQATVTSSFEVAPYYFRHFTNTVTVERLSTTR
jgi:hypothetical protein